MKLNLKNKDAVNAAIAEAEGKSSKRLMTAERVDELVDGIEYTLGFIAPEKDWGGSAFDLTEATSVGSSFAPNATFVTVQRFPSGWFMTNVERRTAKGRDVLPIKLPKFDKSKLHTRNIFN